MRYAHTFAACLLAVVLLGARADADPALVAVVAAGTEEPAVLAADVVATDLTAAGIAIVPMARVAAAAKSLPKAPATAADAAAVARAAGASHALLLTLDAREGTRSLSGHLCAATGTPPLPLQQAPRPITTVESTRFPAHQIANLAAVRLTGRAIASLPSVFEDRAAGKTLGFGRSVEKPAEPLTSGIKVTLTIDRPGGVYRVGEGVKCTLTLDRDCYIAIYNIDPHGKPVLLLPGSQYETDKIRRQDGRYLSRLWAKGGKEYQVPADWVGPEIRFTVLEGQPVGYESLVVVAGTEPVPLPVKPAPGSSKDLRVEAASPSEFADRQAGLLQAPGNPASPTGIAEVKFTTDR